MCEKLKSGDYARIGTHQRRIGQSASTGVLKRTATLHVVLHRARTDQSIDVLAMKPLRKCDGGIGEKILSRFGPSKLFLSQFW